jgi:hypothetical protein
VTEDSILPLKYEAMSSRVHMLPSSWHRNASGIARISGYPVPNPRNDEPADVLGYHKKVAQFPRESTADRWFDESQFESYRALGYHIADKALGDGRALLSSSER